MQPYLFPYYLYWKLIERVDIFVIYDNVNFKKKSFINRNYSFNNNAKVRFTLPLQKASQNKLINEINICQNQDKLIRFLENQYKKSMHFNDIWPIIEDIFSQNETNLAAFLDYSIRNICNYLDIHTEIILASSLKGEHGNLKGQNKILYICKQLGASEYFNLPGGRDLYDATDFQNCNIKLEFLSPLSKTKISNEFIYFQECSIIDLIMNVEKSLTNFIEASE